MSHFVIARVGIQVTNDSFGDRPEFLYRAFHIRGALGEGGEEWIHGAIEELRCFGGFPGEDKIPLGKSRRYWAQVCISARQDYWGEWEQDVEFFHIKRAR